VKRVKSLSCVGLQAHVKFLFLPCALHFSMCPTKNSRQKARHTINHVLLSVILNVRYKIGKKVVKKIKKKRGLQNDIMLTLVFFSVHQKLHC
jgi:hypothetical protein